MDIVGGEINDIGPRSTSLPLDDFWGSVGGGGNGCDGGFDCGGIDCCSGSRDGGWEGNLEGGLEGGSDCGGVEFSGEEFSSEICWSADFWIPVGNFIFAMKISK